MNFYISISKKRVSYKKYVKLILIISLIILNFIALINYIIDPLRMFSHNHKYNSLQSDFNERQQKTNYLKFVNNSFDGIILGSSRTTYINQYNFKNMNLFNYSANNMYPYEYKKFITYSDKLIDNNIKYIVLGVDFFGTNKLENKKHRKDEFLKPAEKLFYRISSLYSIKLFEYSIKNLRFHLKLKKPYYSRNNIKNEPPTYRPNSLMKIEKTLIKHKYEYDEKLINYWKELKKNSNVKFIVFTTPVTIEQMNYYESLDLMKFYIQWLSELVEVFEDVNHFMYPNIISKNYNNFFDANHMLPHVGKLIADFIEKRENNNFGILLNKDNINEFILNYKNYEEIH